MPDPRNRLKWKATCKVYPAIGDLQAIKDRYAESTSLAGQDCTVMASHQLLIVPAGEIWVVTNITAVNKLSICDVIIVPWINAGTRRIKCAYRVAASEEVSWNGMIILVNPDRVRCEFELGGAADNTLVYATGYKVEEY